MSDVKLSKAWDKQYVPETEDTDMGRIDEAIIVLQQIKKRRMKLVKDIEKLPGINPNQKIFIGQEYDLWRKIEVLTKEVEANLRYAMGRVPPHAQDLEEAVVGAILLESKPTDHGLAAMDVVRPFLRPEHFCDDRLKRIYKACYLTKGPIDMRSISNYLRSTGELEAIGGSIYIAEVTAKVSQAANVAYHARIIVEHAMRRELIKGASFVMENAYEEGRDVFGLIEYAKKAIRRIEGWIK